MIVSNNYSRIYGEKFNKVGFDKFNNRYYIRKIENNIVYNAIASTYKKLKYYYINQTLYILGLITTELKIPYKIVYGHFFNKENRLVYKNIVNDKVVKEKINTCDDSELYEENNIIVSSTLYEKIKKIYNKINVPYKKTDVIIYDLHYDYDGNTLKINDELHSKYARNILQLNN